MSDYTFDLSAYKAQLDRIEWIKERRGELDEQEHEARSLLEELLPPVRLDRENDNVVGTINGKPVIQWRSTKTRRLNQGMLKRHFPDVAEFCTQISYGRSMTLLNGQDNA